MRFRLRTLLIVLALGPMLLAVAWYFGAPLVQDRFWPQPIPIVPGDPFGVYMDAHRSARFHQGDKLDAAPQEP